MLIILIIWVKTTFTKSQYKTKKQLKFNRANKTF